MYELADKVAVITGGTRGIGLAIARALLERGSRVVLNGRSRTEELAAIEAAYGATRVAFYAGDVGQPSVCEGLVGHAADAFGRVDMLVHSAGGPVPGKVVDVAAQTWMDAFALHVHPVFHLFRAAHPHLQREGGAVLLVSSVAGLRGCPSSAAYQTVKGALIPLAKAMAFDHAHENIRVNLVTPGIIRTRFHDKMTDAARAHNLSIRIPLRREGSVEDVASAAVELMTNEFITGEYITIDGGMSMRVTG